MHVWLEIDIKKNNYENIEINNKKIIILENILILEKIHKYQLYIYILKKKQILIKLKKKILFLKFHETNIYF